MLTIAYAILISTITSQTPADLSFELIQAEWVAEVCPRWINSPCPPIYEALDSHTYVARQWARSEVAKAPDIRLLVKATHHRSAEVRQVARELIDSLFICPACEGSGVCQACHGYQQGCICSYHRYCTLCTGSGDMRIAYGGTAYDSMAETYLPVFVPRRLFGQKRIDAEE